MIEKTGKIVKGVAGLYFVSSEKNETFECSARGRFRKDGIKPLVGDNVCFQVTEPETKKGSIIEISDRKNELIRPAAANIDQVFLVFAMQKPSPNLDLLDRFLVFLEQKEIPVVICFNKADLAQKKEEEEIREVYEKAGYFISFFSVQEKDRMEKLRERLKGKTTVLAGTSGVGKSSLINFFCKDANMETGEISRKIERGKNTTRHSELFRIDESSFMMDTPGFSSFELPDIKPDELWYFFREMRDPEKECRFTGCTHMGGKDCGVRAAVERGEIHKKRYESYQRFFQEISQRKRY